MLKVRGDREFVEAKGVLLEGVPAAADSTAITARETSLTS